MALIWTPIMRRRDSLRQRRLFSSSLEAQQIPAENQSDTLVLIDDLGTHFIQREFKFNVKSTLHISLHLIQVFNAFNLTKNPLFCMLFQWKSFARFSSLSIMITRKDSGL